MTRAYVGRLPRPDGKGRSCTWLAPMRLAPKDRKKVISTKSVTPIRRPESS